MDRIWAGSSLYVTSGDAYILDGRHQSVVANLACIVVCRLVWSL